MSEEVQAQQQQTTVLQLIMRAVKTRTFIVAVLLYMIDMFVALLLMPICPPFAIIVSSIIGAISTVLLVVTALKITATFGRKRRFKYWNTT